MGSINRSHHHGTGGVVVFNGELILLFCESVHCDVDDVGSTTGKIYLTTHRIIFTSDHVKEGAKLNSFSAPFYAMFDLKLEQPVFGANYIKGKVKSEIMDGPPFAFKLKFNKGGAIEFGQTMAQAASQAAAAARDTNFQAPPPYTPTAAESHYQTAYNAYQPMYPVGFALPTQVFNQAPPAGFVYAMDAPPPYPGLGVQQPATNPYPYAAGSFPQQGTGYPPQFQQTAYAMPPQYPNQAPPYQYNGYGYPGTQPPTSNTGYPGANAPAYPPPYDSNEKKAL